MNMEQSLLEKKSNGLDAVSSAEGSWEKELKGPAGTVARILKNMTELIVSGKN